MTYPGRMRRCLLFVAIAAMGCSSRSETAHEPATSAASPTALEAFPVFKQALAAAAPLVRIERGFENRLAPINGVFVRPTGALRVSFPDRADGVTRIATFVDPQLFVDVRPLNLSSMTAHVEGNVLRMRDSRTGVEEILFSSLERAEEVRVLPRAEEIELAWTLQKGPHVASFRVNGDVLEVLDADGRPRLQTEPMFAVDAVGTRRALKPELHGSTLRVRLDARALVAPIAVDPAWTALTGTMPYISQQATATTLADGKILTSGGYSTGGETVNAATYDPATDTWKSVGAMKSSRREHLLLTLPSGKALAVSSWLNVSTAEVYDPSTETWSFVKSMTYARSAPTGLLTASGKVLIAATNSGSTSSPWPAEVYDPGTDTWTAVRPPYSDRSNGLAAATPSGKLAFVNNLRAEVYDPTSNTWTLGTKATFDHTGEGYAFAGGFFYAFGGSGSTKNSEIERFDPATLAWTHVGRMTSTPSLGVHAIALASGKLLWFTGYGSSGTYAGLFDPATGTALAAGTTTTARAQGTAVRLAGDKVLVFGGSGSGGYSSTAEIWSVPTAPLGTACTRADDCASLRCVDGVCCDSPCDGSCSACNLPGKAGTCSPVDGTDPRGACVGECIAGCKAGVCARKPLGTSCGTATCSAGKLETGTCAGTTEDCITTTATCAGGYTCQDATACRTKCVNASECVTGPCDLATGVCTDFAVDAGPDTGPIETGTPDTGMPDTGVPDTGPPDTGAPDTGPIDTGVADTGADTSIAIDSSVGDTSAPIDAVAPIAPANEAGTPIAPPATDLQRCSTGAECATGFCADGVCCDSPCTERCHSCALPSSPGKCAPTPAGVDLRNECGPPLDCIGTCDGRGYCTGATKGTQCARAQCTGPAKGVGAAFCSAPGARCQTLTASPFDCAPFGCDPVFGACHSRCASSDQCAPGYLCDIPAQSCIAPEPPEEEGCSVAGAPGRGSNGAWLSLVMMGIALRHRRRLAALALAGVGCSSPRSSPLVEQNDELIATMRSFAAIAPMVPRTGTLVLAGEHFRLGPTAASPWRVAGQSALDVHVSASSDGETVLGVLRDPDVWIGVRSSQDAHVAARTVNAAVLYPRVAIDTDAMWFVERDRAEQLRLLRSKSASATTSYRIALGPGVSTIRVAGERLEIVDHKGIVRLGTEPAFAVDARDVRRPLHLALRVDGRVATLTTSFDAAGLTYPIAVDPAFTALPSPVTAHTGGRGALVGGKAIFAGGRSGSTVHSTVEQYDPSTDSWTPLASMLQPRENFAMVALSSGALIVAGGGNPTSSGVSTVEKYDVATNTWTNVASMTYRRDGANGLLLDDGRMLVVGGGYSCGLFCGALYSQAETYDASTNMWSPAGAMQIARSRPQLHKLPSGKVLAVHDQGNNRTQVDLFAPSTNTWSAAAPMPVGRRELVSGLLPSGKVAVFGGAFAGVQTDVYDETTNTWKRVADALSSYDPGFSLILPGGKVLTAGVAFDFSATLYDEAADKFSAAGTIGFNGASAPAVLLPSGQVVVAGAGSNAAILWSPPSAIGTACLSAGDCASGYCVDGVCCTTATCPTGNSCATSTAAGTCKKKSGQSCASNAECGTGVCADGYCCASACTGACRSCGLSSSRGVCLPVVDGASDPHGLCADGPCSSCTSGACVRKPTGSSCGEVCTGATLIVGTCGSDGVCAKALTPCPGALTCRDATQCRWSCSTAADCTTGACVSGSCDVTSPPDAAAYDIGGFDIGAPPDAPGSDSGVTSDSGGSDGSIVSDSGATDDSVTADTGAADTGSPPSDTGAIDDSTVIDGAPVDASSSDSAVDDANVAAPRLDGGTPTLPASIQRCARDEECATGHCADGVCCDTACGERCRSCATLDAPGKCTVLPAGVDLRGECGPVGTCVATCNGAGSCIGAGSGTQCAQQRCTGKSKGVGPSYCAGKGAPCPLGDGVAFDCGPYVCEPLFGACTSSCTKTTECAAGHVCEVATKQCVPVPAPAEDEGGCTTSSRPTGHGSGWALFGAAALFLVARRRVHGSSTSDRPACR